MDKKIVIKMNNSVRKYGWAIIGVFFLSLTHLNSFAATAQENYQKLEDAPYSQNFILFFLIALLLIQIIAIIIIGSGIKSIASGKSLFSPNKGAVLGFLILLGGTIPFNASANGTWGVSVLEVATGANTLWVLLWINLVLFVIVLYLLSLLKGMLENLSPKLMEARKKKVLRPKVSLFDRLNDAVPISGEAVVLTDHEYDGIHELDNNLPPWWKYGFYLTIIWSVCYLFYYDVLKIGPSQEQEYQNEYAVQMEEVEEYKKGRAADVDETTVVYLPEEARLQNGKAIFDQNCVACHQADGGGGVGPNLTDEYWIHGGGIKNVFSLVKYGNVAKGMISWKTQLSPVEIQDVSTYIWSLQGSSPLSPKDPEGKLYLPDNE